MRQRVLTTIAALLLLAGALPGAPAALAASSAVAPATASHLLPMAAARSVQTRTVDVTAAAAAAHGAAAAPAVSLPALLPAPHSPGATHPLITTPAPVQASDNGDPAVPTGLETRPGLTNADNASSVALGDPYVAVGVSEVAELTNIELRITDRRGTQQTDISEDAFFGGSGTGFGTGRIIYDSLHQRWLAVRERVDCMAAAPGPVGYLDFARSDSSDPRGTWLVRSLGFGQNLPDLPTIGTSTDKVAFGVNIFTLGSDGSTANSCLGSGFGTLTGGKLVVLNWAAALGSGSLDFATSISGGFTSTLEWQPAIQEPATSSTLFGAFQYDTSGSGGSATGFGYLRATGLEGSSLTVFIDSLTDGFVSAAFAAQGALTPPREPSSGPLTLGIRAGPSGAVWQGDRLFVVSAWGATPSGDTMVRDTVRVTQLDTTGGDFPTEAQDFYVALEGLDLYGGGIGVDGNGTLHVVGTASGPSLSITSFDAYQRARDAANSVSNLAGLVGGTDDYTGSRWANYVGVAPDPTDSDEAWVATQIADSGGDWITEVSALLPNHSVARLSGNDRYITAVAVSDVVFFAGATKVFIASGASFPDAVAGAAVAGPQGAPLLLMPPGSTIPMAVDRELRRLTPTDIYILGGPASVSEAVKTLLASYVGGGTHVHRIGGTDRYDTARLIAAQFASATGHHVYVANGTEFPDALAGGPLAAKNGGPVLLLKQDSIPAATATELGLLAPADITILGGNAAVSPAVQTALAAFVGHDGTRVHRLGGTDRYDTARLIAVNGWGAGPVGTLYIASGANFPDALAGAAKAGATGAPLLLVTASSIPSPTSTELGILGPSFLVVLGGPVSVGDSVKVTLEGMLP